jgi:hypothetical protein
LSSYFYLLSLAEGSSRYVMLILTLVMSVQK